MSVPPTEFLIATALKQGVSKVELEVLLPIIGGQSIKVVSQEKHLQESTVRKRLGEVYRKFDVPGSGPGKLAELKRLLSAEYDFQQSPVNSLNPGHRGWDNIPDLTMFFGRKDELKLLQKWVVHDRCRLVAIVGMVGMGKTTLAVKLVQEVENHFKRVIWRSLPSPLSLEKVIGDTLEILAPNMPLEGDIDSQLGQLIDCLSRTRCLLVLDGLTTIQKSGGLAGSYREGYEDYGKFFQKLAQGNHQSCLVVIAQEKLRGDTQKGTGKKAPTSPPLEGAQILALERDEETSNGILRSQTLLNQEAWPQLINQYGGIPLALKVVAVTINKFFGGKVASYLKQRTTLIRDICALLDQQVERLDPLEQAIIYWLAIAQKPESFSQLQERFRGPTLPASYFLDALDSLDQRSLLEKSDEGFTLLPVVMEYAIDKLVDTIYDEILRLVRSNSSDALRPIVTYKDKASLDLNPLKFLASYDIKSLYTLDSQHRPQLDRVKGLLSQDIYSNKLKVACERFREMDSQSSLKLGYSEVGYAAENLDYILKMVHS